jgi:hypothetical protein
MSHHSPKLELYNFAFKAVSRRKCHGQRIPRALLIVHSSFLVQGARFSTAIHRFTQKIRVDTYCQLPALGIFSCQIEPKSLKNSAAKFEEGAKIARFERPQFFWRFFSPGGRSNSTLERDRLSASASLPGRLSRWLSLAIRLCPLFATHLVALLDCCRSDSRLFSNWHARAQPELTAASALLQVHVRLGSDRRGVLGARLRTSHDPARFRHSCGMVARASLGVVTVGIDRGSDHNCAIDSAGRPDQHQVSRPCFSRAQATRIPALLSAVFHRGMSLVRRPQHYSRLLRRAAVEDFCCLTCTHGRCILIYCGPYSPQQ